MAARHSGVEVEEFGIFFPPRIWGKKMRSGFVFSVNWLPLGGFVKLKGEHDADASKGSYGATSLPNKIKIMLAGVGMNLAVALILLTVLALVGIPQLITKDQFGEDQFTIARDTKVTAQRVMIADIEPDSPAAKAGLQLRDQIVAVVSGSGEKRALSSTETLPSLTQQDAGQTVSIVYRRDGQERQTVATLRSQKEIDASKQLIDGQEVATKGYLGVVPTKLIIQRSTWSAPIVAIGLAGQMTRLTVKGIGSALKGLGSMLTGLVTRNQTARQNGQKAASQQVSGPVGIFIILKDGSALGYRFMLMIIAIISLTLAIMNILPIPALDGGRLFVTLLFRSFKRPLGQHTEELIHGIGFAFLMLLFVLITVVDIRRFL